MTNPPATVWPTLTARDARALIDFLVTAFGFTETVSYPDADGGIAHAELAWPLGGGVMLGSVPSDPDSPWRLEPGTFGVYVVTDDTDALLARAVAAGAEVLRDVNDTDYGSRDCILRDPEGNRWSFGTYRGHPVTG